MADAARTSSGSPIPGSPGCVSKTTPTSCFRTRSWSAFAVRVSCSGRKIYVVRTRSPHGVSRQATIDSHVGIAAERTNIDRVKRGLDQVPRPEATVAVLAKRYLEAHVAVNCRRSTQETFKRLVDIYILPELGDFAATAVARSHVRALHNALHDKPYQANQVVRVPSIVRDQKI